MPAASNVVPLPKGKAERATQTIVDTIQFTRKTINEWVIPPFQRPIRQNDKVRALAEEISRNGGVLPGIMTLGILGEKTYLLDGQHRREAFMLSSMEEGFTDIRMHHFASMGDMGEEFVRLNSQLVRMRPDDILRGLEESYEPLKRIRQKCGFVGYDMIRRGTSSPIVSMSLVLRGWRAAACEVPAAKGVLASAAAMATTYTSEESDALIGFLQLALAAFSREPEYQKMWGSLNLTLCMWLYRRTVLVQHSPKTPRLTKEMFQKCLMSLTASADYCDWLVGRQLAERDRSPGYNRIKAIFIERILRETGKRVSLPAPAWVAH